MRERERQKERQKEKEEIKRRGRNDQIHFTQLIEE